MKVHMKIFRITKAGIITHGVFYRPGAVLDTVDQLIGFECFKGPVQSNPVGFLKLMFQIGQANCNCLFREDFQNQFPHSGWFDVPGMENIVKFFVHG